MGANDTSLGYDGARLREWKARTVLHGPDGVHWAARQCFEFPSTESVLRATSSLSDAVDALTAGDSEAACSKIKEAELVELLAWFFRVAGKVNHDVIRWRPIDAALFLPRRAVDSGNLHDKLVAQVFRRDGWRCRYCGCRVVLPEARERLRLLLPGSFRWTNSHGDHAGFEVLSGVADHVRPHSWGGPTALANLVTCCAPCNYGKGGHFLESLGLTDPRVREPALGDGWDGLERVLALPRPRVRPDGQEPLPNMAVWEPFADRLGKRARADLLAAGVFI